MAHCAIEAQASLPGKPKAITHNLTRGMPKHGGLGNYGLGTQLVGSEMHPPLAREHGQPVFRPRGEVAVVVAIADVNVAGEPSDGRKYSADRATAWHKKRLAHQYAGASRPDRLASVGSTNSFDRAS
jgi:hypothetical protein